MAQFMSGPLPRNVYQKRKHESALLSDNWHTRTMAQYEDKPNAALFFICKDAMEAAFAAKDLGNAEAEGKYLDQVHYARMEINKRIQYFK
jgi:hypothetical protein